MSSCHEAAHGPRRPPADRVRGAREQREKWRGNRSVLLSSQLDLEFHICSWLEVLGFIFFLERSVGNSNWF